MLKTPRSQSWLTSVGNGWEGVPKSDLPRFNSDKMLPEEETPVPPSPAVSQVTDYRFCHSSGDAKWV